MAKSSSFLFNLSFLLEARYQPPKSPQAIPKPNTTQPLNTTSTQLNPPKNFLSLISLQFLFKIIAICLKAPEILIAHCAFSRSSNSFARIGKFQRFSTLSLFPVICSVPWASIGVFSSLLFSLHNKPRRFQIYPGSCSDSLDCLICLEGVQFEMKISWISGWFCHCTSHYATLLIKAWKFNRTRIINLGK